jgi:hypothetical protein
MRLLNTGLISRKGTRVPGLGAFGNRSTISAISTRVSVHHRAVCTPTKGPGDGSGESAHRKSSDPHGAGLSSGTVTFKAPAQSGLLSGRRA